MNPRERFVSQASRTKRERYKQWYEEKKKDPLWVEEQREKARIRKQKWRLKNPVRNREIDRRAKLRYIKRHEVFVLLLARIHHAAKREKMEQENKKTENAFKRNWDRDLRRKIECGMHAEERKETVNRPSHYAGQGKVECIDFIRIMVKPYRGVIAGDLQNVLKYTWRAQFKNGREDIAKAAWYAEHARKEIEIMVKDPRTHRDMLQYAKAHGNWTREEKDLFNNAMKERIPSMVPEEAGKYAALLKSIANGAAVKQPEKLTDGIRTLKEWEDRFARYRGTKEEKFETSHVNHPGHYDGQVECIDFIKVMVKAYPGVIAGDLQNVLKYTWRAQNKNGKEDIEKAQWYARHAAREIETVTKTPRGQKELSELAEAEGNWTAKEKEIFEQAVSERLRIYEKLEGKCFSEVVVGIANGNAVKSPKILQSGIEKLELWIQNYDRFREEARKRESCLEKTAMRQAAPDQSKGMGR